MSVADDAPSRATPHDHPAGMTDLFPPVPENQRWKVERMWPRYVWVVLQERRRWWGWKTIGAQVTRDDRGAEGIRGCVEIILDVDGWYARNRAEEGAERRRRIAEIPVGTFPRK